jgi:hypothetical protein
MIAEQYASKRQQKKGIPDPLDPKAHERSTSRLPLFAPVREIVAGQV